MNAVCVYVSAAQLVLQSDDTLDANTMQRRLLDIGRLLPHLRQLLSCVVCCRLLNDPFTPRNGRCQHNVCRQCMRDRKSLRPLCPACKDCQDFKMYDENRQMRCLLLCYKSLCEHLISSALFSQISKQRPPHPVTVNNTQPSIPLPHLSTQEFVLEGASYDDVTSSFSAELPRCTTVLRPIVSAVTPTTATVPNSIAHIMPITQMAPKALTPPTASVSSGGGINISSGSNNNNNAHTSLIIPTVPKREYAIVGNALSQTATHSSNAEIMAHSTLATATTATAATTVLPCQQQQLQQQQQQHHHQLQQQQQQTLTIKHLRSIADLSTPAVHMPTTAATAKTLVPGSGTTITYVSGNTPGIVVPIVSSSGTTTAPLTIASAKFRQLSQARAQQALNNSTHASTITTTTANNITLTAPKPLFTELQQQRPPYKLAVTPSGITVAASTTQQQSHNTSSNTTITTATVTSQIRHPPPPIKTVSNGSAMYSVLYTGIGNKITIKRKTDGDEDATQKKNAATAAAAAATAAATNAATTAATTLGVTVAASATSPTNAFRQIPAVKANPKRRGCRCGNATATPGKLTCCGQRCPCYVESKSCIGCKCCGCRNPHRPDGGKVRPVIPELACYEIQMADESSSLSPNDLPIATAATATVASTTGDGLHLPVTQQHTSSLDEYQHSTTHTATVLPSQSAQQPQQISTSTATATIIPLRSLHQLTAATHQQQHLHHQQQTTTQVFTSSNINNIASNNSNMQNAPNSTSNVLLQNAEGKYQVVPLHHFTHAAHGTGHPNPTVVSQIASMQRQQTMTTVNSTFILPNAAAVAAATCPTTSTATQLPQIIMHQQQQQHQQVHSVQQRIGGGNVGSNNNANTVSNVSNGANGLPLQQLQQQLKQNNIITVHPLPPTNNCNNNTSNQNQQQQHLQHHHQAIPLLNNSVSVAPNTTITLSPIIVNSTHAGNTFTADMFHHAAHDVNAASTAVATVGEFLNVKTVRTATPNSNAGSNSSLSPQIITVPLAQASPLANVTTCANIVSSTNNNNCSNAINSISVSVNNGPTHN